MKKPPTTSNHVVLPDAMDFTNWVIVRAGGQYIGKRSSDIGEDGMLVLDPCYELKNGMDPASQSPTYQCLPALGYMHSLTRVELRKTAISKIEDANEFERCVLTAAILNYEAAVLAAAKQQLAKPLIHVV